MAEAGGRCARGLTSTAWCVASGLLMVVVAQAVAGCSSDKSIPEIAARVESASIPSADVEQLAARFMDAGVVDEEHPAIPVGEARRVVIRFLIRSTLLKELAVRASVEPVASEFIEAAIAALTPEELLQSNVQPEDLQASIEAGELSKRLAAKQFPNVAVSDFELHELYDKAATRYAAGWSAEVRVAYLPTQELAEELQWLEPSPEDFETAANQLGATNVGNMGTVSSGDALGEQVLATLAVQSVGQLSEPVQATGGWLIFLVDSREDIPATSFEQARPELLLELEDQKRQDLFVDWFDSQLKAARITVDNFYGSWNGERGDVVD